MSQFKQAEILDALADFLGNDTGGKSVLAQMEGGYPAGDLRPKIATEWARLRSLVVFGYAGPTEIRQILRKIFEA